MCCTPASTSSGVFSSFSGLTSVGSTSARLADGRVAVPDGQGQRLQALLAGRGRQRALLRLVRQVEVFEPLGVVGREDGGAQLVGQLALALDALEDGLLALGELAQQADALLDDAHHLLVEAAGAFLAVARDERDGVALVEQLHHALDLHLADLQGPARSARGRGARVPLAAWELSA